MPVKDFKLQKGDELIVSIRKNSRTGVNRSQTGNPKAVLNARREDDYLARRRVRSGIQFYDLGYLLTDGAYQELVYNLAVTYTTLSGGGYTINEPALADWQALEAAILAVAIGELEQNYFRVNLDAGRYYTFITRTEAGGFIHSTGDEEDASWTDKGLKLTADELAADGFRFLMGNGHFYDLNLTGSGKHKITSVYDYDGDEVDFAPGKSDKIFLFPALARILGEANYNSSGKAHYLVANWRVKPRAAVLDAESDLYHDPLLATWDAVGGDAGDYALAHRVIDLMQQFSVNQQSFSRILSGGSYTWTAETAAAFPPVDEFPAPPSSPGSGAFSLVAQFNAQTPASGVLRAIIKQGGNVFYVWT